MKYFCKYLPVEGEIKDGDKFTSVNDISTNGKILECEYIDNSLLNVPNVIRWKESENYYQQREVNKVKLFLCSRDIQVGDEITWYPQIGPMNVPAIIFDEADIEIVNDKTLNTKGYKVIGEISPDAIWVKEGDEFEEEQLQFWHGIEGNYGYIVNPKVRKDWLKWVTQETPIKVKCSQCNTFH